MQEKCPMMLTCRLGVVIEDDDLTDLRTCAANGPVTRESTW